VQQLGRANVYALLIGSGELEEDLRQFGLSGDHVRITGFVNQSMIPYHIKLVDVLVISSEQDPHPLVATEAAICGVPLVVSDMCGLYGPNDILREGENGFVYPCGNIPALVSRLVRLLDDPDLRISMGRRSIELAEQQSAEFGAEVILGLLNNHHSSG
jgi:glycosyltransferase involved in cell wall biosynthesis